MRIGKYPPGASDREKMSLLRALMEIGHNAAGIIPEGMSMEFPAVAEGDPQAFELMMNWCERSQSKAILGGTLTSQADGKTSTNALGTVHNEVRKEIKDADAGQLASTLSRDLVYPLAVLNGLIRPGDYRRCPRLVFDLAEIKDIGTYATALPAMVAMGMQIPRAWAHTELGIPEAGEDEPVLGQVPPVTDQVALSSVRAAAAAAQPVSVSSSDREDQLARLVATELDPVVAEWVGAIRELVDGAQDLEQIRDGLLALLPNLSVAQFGQAMQHALAIAGAAGMLDALDESRG